MVKQSSSLSSCVRDNIHLAVNKKAIKSYPIRKELIHFHCFIIFVRNQIVLPFVYQLFMVELVGLVNKESMSTAVELMISQMLICEMHLNDNIDRLHL